MKKIILMVIMSGLLLADSAQLTLEEYLKASIKNDPAYQALQYDLDSIEGSLLAVNAMYDIQAFAAYEYGKQDSSAFGTFIMEDSESTMYNFGIKKIFKNTGTNLNATFMRLDQKSESMGSEIITNKPSLTVRLTQPLWRDYLGILSRMLIERMQIQKDVVELSQIENIESYYEDTIELYYDWLSITLTIRPLQESYQNAKEILAQVERQYASDMVNKSDLLRSKEAVLMFENSLKELLYSWNVTAASIYQKMGRTFEPVLAWQELPVVPAECEKFCQTMHSDQLTEIRQLKPLQLLLDQLELDLKKNDRQAKPSLAVYAENSNYKIEDAETDNFSDLEDREYKLGLEFSSSLGWSDTRGEEQKLTAELEKTRKNLKATRQNLEIAYQNLLLNMKIIEDTEKNAKKIAELSGERLQLETRRYQSGKTLLSLVADYRNQYAQNQVNYLKKQLEKSKLNIKIASMNDKLYEQVQQIVKQGKGN